MASIAPFAPTPQHSLAHMQPVASPPQAAGQIHGLSTSSFGPGFGMNFDGAASQDAPVPVNYSQSFNGAPGPPYQNGPLSSPGYSRSFGDYDGSRVFTGKPQIYTAVYSGVSVYEMEIQGVACMRRRSDGWLNATQILKVAGVDKGKRTKVLEKEILTGEHEKVQGGYGKYQGTWISYRRGREFCRQYGVEDILRPLLDYDVTADGSGGQGQQDTPTKEQAMAANRKRFYNTSLDASRPNGPASNGTFFSNISPTTSVALAAMNKAARLNSPAPRPASAHRPGVYRQQSHQDNVPQGSQQSVASNSSFKPEPQPEPVHSMQVNGEPPRKRMRSDSQDMMAPPSLPVDVSMRSVTPTEPNESFLYENVSLQEATNDNGEPIALAPLPTPTTDEQQEKMGLILDLFAEVGRTDYSNHAALTRLSGEDLNIPLDASANNALHWAATLAKIPLLKLLIKKGANLYRGNAAGQSPLISAVLVSNCWEHTCFPELLELLGPLIEVRDLQGRTILHHIAVSSGIKGRAPSSKYYLEALLEFLVRIGTQSNASATAQSVAAAMASGIHTHYNNGDVAGEAGRDLFAAAGGLPSSKGGLTLVRFLSHIVNARDKAGNTALNLVARIGNRSIIQQLLEIHADPNLPNHKGVSAKDFGVGADAGDQSNTGGVVSSHQSPSQLLASQASTLNRENTHGSAPSSGSQVDDLSQDVISTMTSMLMQSLTSHKDMLRQRTEQIDELNQQIKEFSNLHREDMQKFQEMQERVRIRSERQAKIANLKRAIAEKRRESQALTSFQHLQSSTVAEEVNPSWLNRASQEILDFDTSITGDGSGSGGAGADGNDCDGNNNGNVLNSLQRQFLTSNVPSLKELRLRLSAYKLSNANLQAQADQLRARSTELHGLYRRVVSLCTGVPEEKVEENLPALLAAVESERGALGEQEVGRIREFLRRVDASRPKTGTGGEPGTGNGSTTVVGAGG